MNIHKYMEVIFVVALAAVCLGTVLFDQLLNVLPNAEAKPPAPVARNIATPTSMAVVIIKAPHAHAGN